MRNQPDILYWSRDPKNLCDYWGKPMKSKAYDEPLKDHYESLVKLLRDLVQKESVIVVSRDIQSILEHSFTYRPALHEEYCVVLGECELAGTLHFYPIVNIWMDPQQEAHLINIYEENEHVFQIHVKGLEFLND